MARKISKLRSNSHKSAERTTQSGLPAWTRPRDFWMDIHLTPMIIGAARCGIVQGRACFLGGRR
ncbi:MAG: hypothetical protein ABI134_12270 [Byssovorax sp.]